MPPKAAASNDLDMVKALTGRLEELNATAAEFQVMGDEGENKLREAARNAPPRPLTLRQMRALDRCDEVRTPSTGSDRDYEELQDEMDRLEQSIEETGRIECHDGRVPGHGRRGREQAARGCAQCATDAADAASDARA